MKKGRDRNAEEEMPITQAARRAGPPGLRGTERKMPVNCPLRRLGGCMVPS